MFINRPKKKRKGPTCSKTRTHTPLAATKHVVGRVHYAPKEMCLNICEQRRKYTGREKKAKKRAFAGTQPKKNRPCEAHAQWMAESHCRGAVYELENHLERTKQSSSPANGIISERSCA